MAVFIEPRIEPEDYETFYRLSGSDLPDTHDEWLQLLSEQRPPRLKARHMVKQITIKPDEFIEFCETKWTRHNLQALYTFVRLKYASRGK